MATYPSPQTQHDDDPLSYEKVPSLSFRDAQVGTTYRGTIVKRARLLQQRDFESQQPKTWPDGNPCMAAVIHLEIQGEIYAIWAPKPSAMFAALVAAQKEAGAGPMVEGGTLHVRFEGTEPNKKNPKLNAQKLYRCKYEPPAQPDPFHSEAGAQTVPPHQAPRPTAPPAPQPQPTPSKAKW